MLRAYGWDDFGERAQRPEGIQFLLDYEEEDSSEGLEIGKKSRKKKPWR